ncbi:hypothetical protein NL108_005369 [Boleophthalmus pectinirostris]|uniref:transcriptional-regulating factor 1-like n=1 Tax=Boleophthalmus pectinirostris TaxID=150288 RepID=UPI0024326499|nr:transcriptional-regulating factor 1-like [Boleophthalmus pectinirostris]XP_020779522.2 transcriptional-regulating factor 1-like [Boleophthalmus pectinirostris]XP_055012502.1 transcriptional-regulating factor 1-like [Boleophthalmus pectinirostris]XP_055012503.1 transcriptional-regulating factor 1-like [Boleophthalmus pectinirostris]XP_055012504.1 transcriptional-regulating factor 1-like [Boleophthalmus pectinirostris]KAJ0055517.1 hypothetical protein NL108_005369 [Boleophthalmus pectinirostr
MDDCSPTHAFPNLHLPQPFHIVLPDHHSSEPGYSSAQPPLPLPSQDDQTIPCFPTFDDDQREVCNEAERSLLSAHSLDDDFNMGGHFEEEERHSWYVPKETWDGNTESSTDDYYAKANCHRGHRGTTSYSSCSQLTYNRKANSGYVAKQTNATYFRDSEHNSGHIGLDYSRTNSVTSDLDREDFGGGLHEERLQSSIADTGSWLIGENSWRGESCSSSFTPQKTLGLNSRTYPQKLDSFSDAFMSQAKRRLPVITTADAHNWDSLVRPRLSCSLDSDSSSPSLPSFPSPPSSNLLSPPPTPLTPASHSPSKVDSPSGGGLAVHAGAQGGEGAVGALQFFPVRPQSLLGPNSAGVVWRFPLLSHCFTQLAGETSSSEGTARASIASNLNYNTGPHNVQSLVSSSPLVPVLHPPRSLCSSVHPFFHSASLSSLTSNHQNEDSTKQKPSTLLGTSHDQDPGCPVYTGTTFPSMLQCESRQRRAHFTPQPLLNPLRRGTGLYSSLRHKDQDCGEEQQPGPGVLPCINVGPDFQADIPPCLFANGVEDRSRDEDKSPPEHLLWKPWNELTYNASVQEQVEKLLQMSSSSCVPGGGTNTELALHCLHRCHGDIMVTLEMLLFTQPRPAGDYHYPGADVWTEKEKRLFTAALETYGKDFSLIHTQVKTKTVNQCVEFYYLWKRLGDKQKKFNMEEEGTAQDIEQPKKAPPTRQPIARQIRLEEMVPVPFSAGSFPCKLCGKMFYKIKSRNAHMKIHRQPQEDWTDRKLQQQMLNRALSRGLIVQPQTFSENNTTNGNSINLLDTSVQDHMNLLAFNSSGSHVLPNVNTSPEPTSVLQFQSIWGPFGQNSDPSSFFCSTEVKTEPEEDTAAAKWK